MMAIIKIKMMRTKQPTTTTTTTNNRSNVCWLSGLDFFFFFLLHSICETTAKLIICTTNQIEFGWIKISFPVVETYENKERFLFIKFQIFRSYQKKMETIFYMDKKNKYPVDVFFLFCLCLESRLDIVFFFFGYFGVWPFFFWQDFSFVSFLETFQLHVYHSKMIYSDTWYIIDGWRQRDGQKKKIQDEWLKWKLSSSSSSSTCNHNVWIWWCGNIHRSIQWTTTGVICRFFFLYGHL